MAVEPPEGQVRLQIEVEVPEAIAHGVYANYVDIKTSLYDYVLTFCRIVVPEGRVEERQAGGKAVALSRVVISPSLMQPLLEALMKAKGNRERLLRSASEGTSEE